MHLVALNAADRPAARPRARSTRPFPARRRTSATGRRARRSARRVASLMGAAGSEYGIRGFVMALAHEPHAGVGEPVLDDPAAADRVAQARAGSSAAARSGRRSRSTRRRTPSTSAPARRRRSTSPSLRPGPAPRTDSLIAVDLITGTPEVVAAADGPQRVGVRHRAAAARLHREGRRASGAASSRSRRWKASGSPTTREPARRSTSASRCIDRVEHPSLKPGQPVAVFPAAIGGLNYSPASYDPATNLHHQRGRRDGRRADPGRS